MSEIGRIILINKKGGDGAFLPIPRNSEQDIIIGKCATADIRIQNEALSDEHCSICYNGHKAIIRNLTKAVTFVNSVSLNKQGQQVVLKHNDLIQIEDRTFRWEYLQDVALSGESKGAVTKGRRSEPPIKITSGGAKNQSFLLTSPVFKRRSLMLKKPAASTSLSKANKSNSSLRKINKNPGLNRSHLDSAAKLRNPNILRVIRQGLLPSPSPGDDAGGEVNKVSGVLSPKKPAASPAPGPSVARLNGKSATSPRRNVAAVKPNSPQGSKSAGRDATDSTNHRVSSGKRRRSQPSQSPKLSRAKRKLNLNEHSGELGDSLTSINDISSTSDDPYEFFSISNSEPSIYEDSMFSPNSGSSPAATGLFHSTALLSRTNSLPVQSSSKNPSTSNRSLKNRSLAVRSSKNLTVTRSPTVPSPKNRTIVNGSLVSPSNRSLNNRSRSLLSKTISPRLVSQSSRSNISTTGGKRRSRPSRSPEFESTLTFWENLTDNDQLTTGGSGKKPSVANVGSPNQSRKNTTVANGASLNGSLRRSQTFSLSNISIDSKRRTSSHSALSVTPINMTPNSWLTSTGPSSSIRTKSARKTKSASSTPGDDTMDGTFSSSFYSPQPLKLATENNAIFTPYTCEISPRSRVGSPRSLNTTPSVPSGGRKSDEGLIHVCNKVTADEIEKALSAPAALERSLKNSSHVVSFNTSSSTTQSFTPSPVKQTASIRRRTSASSPQEGLSASASKRLQGSIATPSPHRASTRSVTPTSTPVSPLTITSSRKATPKSVAKKTPDSSKKNSPAKSTPTGSGKNTPSKIQSAQKLSANSRKITPAKSTPGSVAKKTPASSRKNTPAKKTPTISKKNTPVKSAAKKTPTSSRKNTPAKSTPQSVTKNTPGSSRKNTPAKSTPQSVTKNTPGSSRKNTPAKSTPQSVTKNTSASSKKNTPAKSTPQSVTKHTPASSRKNTPAKSSPQSVTKNTPAKSTPQSVIKNTPGSSRKNTPAKSTQSVTKNTPASSRKNTPAKSAVKKTTTSSRKNTPAKETSIRSTKSTPRSTLKRPPSSKKITPKNKVLKTPESLKKKTPAKGNTSKKASPASLKRGTPKRPSLTVTPGKTPKRTTPKSAVKKTPVVSKKTPAKVTSTTSQKSTPAKSTQKATFSGIRSGSSPLVVFSLVTPKELPQIHVPGEESRVSTPRKGSARKSTQPTTPFSASRKSTSPLVVLNLITPGELPKFASPKNGSKIASPQKSSTKKAIESPAPFSASRRSKSSPLVVYNLVTPAHAADAEAICHEADEIISPNKSSNTSLTEPNVSFTASRTPTSPLVVYNLVTATNYATPVLEEEKETLTESPASRKRGRSLTESPATPSKELSVLNLSRKSTSPLVVYNLLTPVQVKATPVGKQSTETRGRQTPTSEKSPTTPAAVSTRRSARKITTPAKLSSGRSTPGKTSASRSSSASTSGKKGTTPITLKAIGPSSSGKKSVQGKKATPKSSTKAADPQVEGSSRISVAAVKKSLRFSALPSPATKSPKTPSTKSEESVVLLSATKQSSRKRKLAETIDLALERSEFPSPDDFSLHPLSSAKLGKFSRSTSGTFSGTFASPSLLGRRSSAQRSVGALSPRLSTPYPRKTTTRVSFDPKLDKGSPAAAASKSRKSSLKTVLESSRHSFGSDSSLNYSDVSDLGRQRKGFTSTPMPPKSQGHLHSILKVVSRESFDGSHVSTHSDKSLRYNASTTFGDFDSPQISRDVFVSPLTGDNLNNESTTSRRSENISRRSASRRDKSITGLDLSVSRSPNRKSLDFTPKLPVNRTKSPSQVSQTGRSPSSRRSSDVLQHSLVHSTSNSPNLDLSSNELYAMSTLSRKDSSSSSSRTSRKSLQRQEKPASLRQSVNLKQYTNFLLARSPNQGYETNLSGVDNLFAIQPSPVKKTPPQSPTVTTTVRIEKIKSVDKGSSRSRKTEGAAINSRDKVANKRNNAPLPNSEEIVPSPVAARQTRNRKTTVNSKTAPKKKPSKVTKAVPDPAPVEVKEVTPLPVRKTRRNAPASPSAVPAKKRKEESPGVKSSASIVKKSSRLNPSSDRTSPAAVNLTLPKKSTRATKSDTAASSAPASRVVTPKTRRGRRARAKSDETMPSPPAVTRDESVDKKVAVKASKRKTRATGPTVSQEEKGPTPAKRAKASDTPAATPAKTRRGRTRGDSTKECTPVKNSPKRVSKATTKVVPKTNRNAGKEEVSVKDSPLAVQVKSKKAAVRKLSTPVKETQGRATRRNAAPVSDSPAKKPVANKSKSGKADVNATPQKTTSAKQTNKRGGKKTAQVELSEKKTNTLSSPAITPIKATRSGRSAAGKKTKSPAPVARRKKVASPVAKVSPAVRRKKAVSPVAKASPAVRRKKAVSPVAKASPAVRRKKAVSPVEAQKTSVVQSKKAAPKPKPTKKNSPVTKKSAKTTVSNGTKRKTTQKRPSLVVKKSLSPKITRAKRATKK